MYDYKKVELAVVFGLGQRRKALIDAASDRQSQAQVALSAAQARREAIERQLDNLIQLVQASGGGSRLGKQVQALEAELEAVETEVAKLDRTYRQSRPADIDEAAAGLKAVYDSLNVDPDDLAIRAAFQQRLKLLVDHVVLGSTGFVATHSDGSTSRTSFAGPRR